MKHTEWSDQPKAVQSAAFVTEFFSEGFIWQIRSRGNDRWYVTGGNLFGSATWQYNDYRTMLEELGKKIVKAKRKELQG